MCLSLMLIRKRINKIFLALNDAQFASQLFETSTRQLMLIKRLHFVCFKNRNKLGVNEFIYFVPWIEIRNDA